MPLSNSKIGFIGLGLMGAPMAVNLSGANAKLTVYNRTASKCQGVAEKGAVVAASPKAVAEETGVGFIILCVSDTPSLKSAICDTNGVLAGMNAGSIVIDMGTTAVSETRVLANMIEQAGGHYIDAPVSGGEVGAKAGSLSIMAGGNSADIECTKPVFDVLGASLTHIGPVGTGQAAKVANQTIVGATLSIIAESFALAQSAGADLNRVREALLGGFAGSRILELHGQRMIDGAFAPGGRSTTQLKDLQQAIDLVDETGLSLPFMRKNLDLWAEMVDCGFGNLDQSGYYKFVQSRLKGSSN